MGERLTKEQKISDGKCSGGGERERESVSNCQGTSEGRGSERVEPSRGGELSGGGGGGREGQSSGIICTVTLPTSFASVNWSTRVKLCRRGTGRCCVVVGVSD